MIKDALKSAQEFVVVIVENSYFRAILEKGENEVNLFWVEGLFFKVFWAIAQFEVFLGL